MPQNSRILIVDDDPVIAHLISTMLQKKGYVTAGIVETGEEAILKSADLAPDLIIMDVSLAGSMDGMDAAHYIFQLFHFPIIFITGIIEEEKLDRVKYSRPYGIIFKPFTMIEIATSINLALYNHANRPGGQDRFPVGDPKTMMANTQEGVILTDKRGRVIFCNTYAAWFVDLPPLQIMMKHWRDVFMIINDQTGEEEQNDFVAEAVRNMTATVLETNTGIVTTTSKRRKARLSIRPIKDDHDRFLAVFISIKEKIPHI